MKNKKILTRAKKIFMRATQKVHFTVIIGRQRQQSCFLDPIRQRSRRQEWLCPWSASSFPAPSSGGAAPSNELSCPLMSSQCSARLPASWLPSAVAQRSALRWSAFADICCPFWQAALSAAHCIVRVTARCDRPPAVKRQCFARGDLGVPSVMGRCSFKGRLRRVSVNDCRIGGRHTHIQGRATSWDCSGGENVSRPGCCGPDL